MDDHQPEQNLSSFEHRLRACRPRAPQLDRDRLMFLAGQHAQPRQANDGRWSALRAWQCATAVSLSLAAVFAGQAYRNQDQVVERIVYMTHQVPLAAEPAPPLAAQPPAPRAAQPPALPAAQPDERPDTSPRGVTRLAAAPPSHAPTASRGGYLHTRNLALRLGVDALPMPVAGNPVAAVLEAGEILPQLRPGAIEFRLEPSRAAVDEQG